MTRNEAFALKYFIALIAVLSSLPEDVKRSVSRVATAGRWHPAKLKDESDRHDRLMQGWRLIQAGIALILSARP